MPWSMMKMNFSIPNTSNTSYWKIFYFRIQRPEIDPNSSKNPSNTLDHGDSPFVRWKEYFLLIFYLIRVIYIMVERAELADPNRLQFYGSFYRVKVALTGDQKSSLLTSFCSMWCFYQLISRIIRTHGLYFIITYRLDACSSNRKWLVVAFCSFPKKGRLGKWGLKLADRCLSTSITSRISGHSTQLESVFLCFQMRRIHFWHLFVLKWSFWMSNRNVKSVYLGKYSSLLQQRDKPKIS